MSLGIVIKGTEGIVLATDSRVTLMATLVAANPLFPSPQQILLPATFDNATKLFQIKNQKYVGVITHGAGAIGQDPRRQRTPNSFLPEFDMELSKLAKDQKLPAEEDQRLSVEDISKKLSEFFMIQWEKLGMPKGIEPDKSLIFLIGGYDKNEPYGKIFEIVIPNKPTPEEKLAGQFGAVWGGQREFVDRIIQGFDARTPNLVGDIMNIPAEKRNPALGEELKKVLSVPIPWQFLPLQDCVDLSIFFVKATINLHKWVVGIRGVGGMVEVATITRDEGFRPIQRKQISGEQVS